MVDIRGGVLQARAVEALALRGSGGILLLRETGGGGPSQGMDSLVPQDETCQISAAGGTGDLAQL